MEVVLKLCVTWILGQFKEIQWFWVRLTGWGKSTHDSIDERRRGEEEVVLHSSRSRQGFWSLPGAYHPNRFQIFRSNQRLHGAGFLEVCALHVSWGCPSLPLYEINLKYFKPWTKLIKPETNQNIDLKQNSIEKKKFWDFGRSVMTSETLWTSTLKFTSCENFLLHPVDWQFVFPVKKIGKFHEADQSVFINITVIHEIIKHWVTDDHVKLVADFLQILLIDFPLTLL